MGYLRILFLSLCICGNLTAQQITTAQRRSVQRGVPLVGFNLNSLTKPTWANRSFSDSVRSLGMHIIRYPGGTESQYFDWETGKIVPLDLWTNGTLKNFQYLAMVRAVPHTLEDFKVILERTSAKPLFCLNAVTSTLSRQLAMLRRARELGMAVEYIELANELFFEDADFVNKYPTATSYAADMRIWIDSIRKEFPTAKIALLGATEDALTPSLQPTPTRILTWNDALFAANLRADAITFHHYFLPGTSRQRPQASELLAGAFRTWQRYKAYTSDSVRNGMEIWLTEYNLNDAQNDYTIASSWIHGVFDAVLFHLMLQDAKNSMLLLHQITGNPTYASLDSYTDFGDTTSNRLTAQGNAIRLWHTSAVGADSVAELTFSPNPSITVGNTSHPSLIGWRFSGTRKGDCVLINLSGQDYTVRLGDLYPILPSLPPTFESISAANPLQLRVTTKDLTIRKGIVSSHQVSVPSYGLVRLSLQDAPTSVTTLKEPTSVTLAPNPVDHILHVAGLRDKGTITIVNMLGNILCTHPFAESSFDIDISVFPIGIFLCHIQTPTQRITTRFSVIR